MGIESRGGQMSALREQYVVGIKGRKTALILSRKRYGRLMEDLHDLAVVAERRKEMKRRLKKDGSLSARVVTRRERRVYEEGNEKST